MHQAAELESFPYPFKEDVYRYSNNSTARHHVFYAAGIGITPFLTMMAELDSFLSEGQKNAQNVILTCVSRAKSEKIIIDI